MKTSRRIDKNRSESGIALLIAIFVLLLISAVAISLVVSSGTESSLAGNYRTSLSASFAADAGIEEARGRLVGSNPNAIALPLTAGVPSYLPTNQVVYITNPAVGEPAGAALLADPRYVDTEFDKEFKGAPTLAAATKTYVDSIWTAVGNTGPLYKWVRINAATKQSLQVDVDNTGLAAANATTPLYYDSGLVPTSLVVPPTVGGVPNPNATSNQALEITGLAVLPNGSQKLSQYVVAPVTYGLKFPSSLTLGGPIGNFLGANSNQYKINGQDGSGGYGTPSDPAVPGCAPGEPTVSAIGVSPGSDAAGNMTNQAYLTSPGPPAPLPRPDHYQGAPPNPPLPGNPPPSVSNVSLPPTLSSPAALDQLVQTIRNNADAVIPNPPNPPNYNNSGTTYNFGGPGWPSGMSPTNPQVVYVDGSFNLGPNTGSGLLVVTGNFTYTGNSGWNGIILVIGDGTTTFLGSGGGNGQFNGAIFAATTRSSTGAQLPTFGTLNYDSSGGGGNGIYYDSCWIKRAQQPPKYQVLSFQEK